MEFLPVTKSQNAKQPHQNWAHSNPGRLIGDLLTWPLGSIAPGESVLPLGEFASDSFVAFRIGDLYLEALRPNPDCMGTHAPNLTWPSVARKLPLDVKQNTSG